MVQSPPNPNNPADHNDSEPRYHQEGAPFPNRPRMKRVLTPQTPCPMKPHSDRVAVLAHGDNSAPYNSIDHFSSQLKIKYRRIYSLRKCLSCQNDWLRSDSAVSKIQRLINRIAAGMNSLNMVNAD